jgi:PKD repeat protein
MPYLIIQTLGGCIDYSYRDTITVVTPPNVTATFPSIVCAGQAVMMSVNGSTTSSVPSSTYINHWHVDTDDHFFSGCITNKNPVFPFTHVGIHNVTVTAMQAGCEGSQVLPQTITVM